MSTSPSPCRVLLTAFDAYSDGSTVYGENASRLALEFLISHPPTGVMLETRIYPVDFATIRQRVEQDIACGFDIMLLTGQSPTSDSLKFEKLAKNIGRDSHASIQIFPLAFDGPNEVRASAIWWEILARLTLNDAPVGPSEDAGDYLCNAALYFALLASKRRWQAGSGRKQTLVGFIHIPLAPQQVAAHQPYLDTKVAADLLCSIISDAASATQN